MSFYAVKVGRNPGIYATWEACKEQINGFSGPVFKKFSTRAEAEGFIAGNVSITTKPSNKTNKTFFYAVKEGREPGIYLSWSECEKQITGFFGARYKKFPTKEQAQAFIDDVELPIPTMEEDERIIVFTDGACPNNGKDNARASYAVVFPHYPSLNTASLLDGVQTNNRAEYTAMICAYDLASKLDKNRPIHIYSDSKLLVNFIKSLPRSLSGLKNVDLCERIAEIVKEGRLHIFHVRAHTGNMDFFSYWNNEVDRLANSIL